MTMLGVEAGDGRLRWDVPEDAAATRTLGDLEYDAQSEGDVVTLRAREAFRGVRLVQRYVLSADGDTLDATMQVPPGARLLLESGTPLVPEPLPGFAGMYDGVEVVRISAGGQEAVRGGTAVAVGEWVGVRDRFWAFLLRPATGVTGDVSAIGPDRPRLALQPGSDAPLHLRVYAGPVEPHRLGAVDTVLDGMLFPELWSWLRFLAFGLRRLVDGWHGLVGSWGVAIVLLSLSVKVLMWPLTSMAERWQRQVNRLRSRLEPELASIRREHRGEEAHRRTLEVYRRHGASPLYPVRSALGVLVQIPVFIAAFDMLGEHFGLYGASFLWIDDLSSPDRFARLPLALPLVGGSLNLLPFLMTGLTLLAARVQEEPTLSPVLRAGQRRHLYGMAAAFFVVLYGFPAGMVLYWTSNNFWHLVKVAAARARG
jgi:YidC/Oxa1 family membrane protein insertase